MALRNLLSYPDHSVPIDIYDDFRSIGIHIFRRKLGNSKISGLFIMHPVAGKCVLVNINEDVYRGPDLDSGPVSEAMRRTLESSLRVNRRGMEKIFPADISKVYDPLSVKRDK